MRFTWLNLVPKIVKLPDSASLSFGLFVHFIRFLIKIILKNSLRLISKTVIHAHFNSGTFFIYHSFLSVFLKIVSSVLEF